MASVTRGPELRGRRREQEALEALLRQVRAGQSRALVLRGEIGSGKSALLDHLAGRAGFARVLRASGVESESEIAYSALQQLCAPLLDHLDALAAPQRAALSTAFGLAAGPAPERLLVGIAVLGLFAEAAARQPLVCIVDDVQWIDVASAVTLGFVARRLSAESVALVFAARPTRDEQLLTGLPELTVAGLPDADARALLDSVLTGPVDARVRDRIVAETRGNPLALLQLPRGLSPAELAFGFGGDRAAPLAGRVEQGFQRRIAALPAETRTALIAAAVEPVGDPLLLRRALDRLGVGPAAAAPAEIEQLIEFGARVRFPHPLVRSAAWRSADAAELRRVHAALAEATDPAEEPDRRAWHRAHAAVGPDDEVATELEASAGRALARGGWSAAAAFLERAAALTVQTARRGELLVSAAAARAAAGSFAQVPALLAAAEIGNLDPLQRARVERLRAQVAFMLRPGRDAGPPLLAAARRLEKLDPVAARDTLLMALGAAIYAGRFGGDDLRVAAEAARAAAPVGDEYPDLLLAALASWVLDGRAAALPLLHRALDAESGDAQWVWLASFVGYEVYRLDLVHRMSERAVRAALDSGSLSLLPSALATRAGSMVYAGRLSDAAGMMDEIDAIIQATGASVYQFFRLVLAAYRGPADTATELFEARLRDAATHGDGRLHGLAHHALAILRNGLGDHRAAMAAASEVTGYHDFALGAWALPELVEAAALAGEPAVARTARDRLAALTADTPTRVARGIQALADALVGDAPEKNYRAAVELLGVGESAANGNRARLLFGEWLHGEGRRAEARIQLHAAHEAFAAMGAAVYAERAARDLASLGETVVRRTVGVPAQLTPQEAAIAQLAATRRTNTEIATQLFLSPRTVEWHLRKIFTKLGITSRRDLSTALLLR